MRARLTVKSAVGYCYAGHKVGDSLIFDGGTVQVEQGDGRICAFALPSLVPYLAAYCRQTPESDWINHLSQLQCPDATNTVIWSVERID